MMNRKIAVAAVAALASALLTIPVFVAAQQPPSRADNLVKYRKAMYTVMYNNFASLGGMVAGRAPFDAKAAQTRAERVAYMSLMIGSDAFLPESAEGTPTKAKPAIFTDRAEFDRLLGAWQKAAATLAKEAKSGKLEKIKPAFGATKDACDTCHKKFKED